MAKPPTELRHGITNASGILALAFWCFENWMVGYLGEWWQSVSWGWFALLLGAIWLGAQAARFEIGDHWLQSRWRAWRTRVFLSAPRYVNRGQGGYEVFADVRFSRDVRNVVVRFDVLQQIHTLSDVIWKRAATYDAINRLECNAGHTEEVKLIQVLPAPKAEVQNALLVAAMPGPPPQVGDGFFRVRVKITGAGMAATERDYDFWWQKGFLNALPLLPRDGEMKGDKADLKQGGFTLWRTTE